MGDVSAERLALIRDIAVAISEKVEPGADPSDIIYEPGFNGCWRWVKYKDTAREIINMVSAKIVGILHDPR